MPLSNGLFVPPVGIAKARGNPPTNAAIGWIEPRFLSASPAGFVAELTSVWRNIRRPADRHGKDLADQRPDPLAPLDLLRLDLFLPLL